MCRLFPEAQWTRAASRVGYWKIRGHEIRSFSKLMKIAQHYHVIDKLPVEIQNALRAVAAAPAPPAKPAARTSAS